MGGGEHLVRIEGVNIDETVYDTQNLSVIRGGSLTLLAAPGAFEERLRGMPGILKVEPVLIGASQGLFLVTVEDDSALEWLRDFQGRDIAAPHVSDNAAPYETLRLLAVSTEFDGSNDQTALETVTAKTRLAQLRSWTVEPETPQPFSGVCALDRVRTAEKGEDRSVSVRRRFEYGRHARQTFYTNQIGELANGLSFTDDLEEMTADPPNGVPDVLQEKIAVFYADGNKFGQLRAELGGTIETERDFSKRLGELQRESLLAGLLSDLTREEVRHRACRHGRDTSSSKLRFETLLWGGDELCWVMPAWMGWRVLRAFYELTGPWAYRGRPLTHAAGLLFCHRKTPIRQARALAQELAEEAKGLSQRRLPCNAFQVEVMTSIDIPEKSLRAYRKRVFGANAPSFVFRVPELEEGGFAALDARISDCIERGLPRSKLYQLLRMARGRTGFVDPGSPESLAPLHAELIDYLAGPGARLPGAADSAAFLNRYRLLEADRQGNGEGSGQGATPLYSLAVVATLWEYVDPFGDARMAEALANGDPA